MTETPPIADLEKALEAQLALFTPKSIRAREVMPFDPLSALNRLQEQEGRQVLAVDIGGDKIAARILTVNQSNLADSVSGSPKIDLKSLAELRASEGRGYLFQLSGLAVVAARYGLPVGISTAGLVEGTCLRQSPNLPLFMSEFKGRRQADFSRIFNGLPLFVQNDAVAGLMAAAVQAAREGKPTEYLLYLINGGGVGSAALRQGKISATEAGHTPLTPGLNRYGVTEPCQFTPQDTHICLEKGGFASGAGIEKIWAQLHPDQPLDGREISALAQKGNLEAQALYEHSALLAALTVKGVAQALEIPLDPNRLTVAGHGGGFKAYNYPELFSRYLAEILGFPPNLVFTQDFSPNACLDGAALGALTL